jgi:protein-S-isoprenylcysteine O-methyltransferase Ste14
MQEDAETTMVRSQAEIDALRAEREGGWPAIRWVHRRRPILTAALVLAAPAHTLLTEARPADLLDPREGWRFAVPWLLMLAGVAIRIWGSGNLRKNQEITQTGIYRMVRHPLYTGSLAVFLAYFLTVGDPALGVVLFAGLLGVYYATMLGEEEFLELKFPEQARRREPLPRLLPNPLRLPEALRSDRFTLRSSYANLGLRSLWVLVLLPAVLYLLRWADAAS